MGAAILRVSVSSVDRARAKLCQDSQVVAAKQIRVGLIADTHGLLRPEAKAFLTGADRIVHAGDIGARQVLDDLESLAPVAAVRGNNDVDSWTRELCEARILDVGQVRVYTLHDLAELAIDPAREHVHVIVSGHSHQPKIDSRDGVLLVNPGSAGRRRFKLPISIGELLISGRRVRARIYDLPSGLPILDYALVARSVTH